MIGRDPARQWVVAGGEVISRTDGQRHYVSADQVARSHRLRDDEWRRWDGNETAHLWPRHDGDYRNLRDQVPVTPPPTVIVAGLGRCGTSMVMQMLAAGGIATVGTFPDFEDMDTDRQRSLNPAAWLARCEGRAVKVLDPQRVPPPAGQLYRTIWLTRDPEQQGRSQIKLIDANPSRAMRRAMAQSIRRDEPRARRALAAADLSGRAMLQLTFEGILGDPFAAARAIVEHIGAEWFEEGAAWRMATAVMPRGPHCLPFMLETHLLQGAAA